ncbi:MAG: hypothetical protein ABSD29_13460 [Verrucomicrobiota bacterium]|jgi:hypothetical protein
MSKEITIPKVQRLSLVAILRQIRREKLRGLLTDAERNQVFAGKTAAGKLLILGEVLNKKDIKYKK